LAQQATSSAKSPSSAPAVELPRGPGGNYSLSGVVVTAPGADDPEMAALAQSEAELAHQSVELSARYASSEDVAEQKKIKAELRETLVKQFDVQKQRRELELARIEERVRKLREQIKKRNDSRETIIDRRLEQLVDDAEGLGWAPEAGS